MRMDQAIKLFLEHCEFEKNLSHKTLQFYKIDLLQFQEFLESEQVDDIGKIDKHIIKTFVQKLVRFKPRTRKRKIASSKAFLNFLEFEDYIAVNPFRKIRTRIKEPKELPTVLDLEEIKTILAIVQQERDQLPNINGHRFKQKLRDLAVLELLFSTGIRVSELCNLTPQNINLSTGHLLINGKGNKERMVSVCNKESLTILRNYQEAFSDQIASIGYFFVSRIKTRLSTQSVRFLISKYVKQTNISKHVTPHTFRHTFATLLLEQDVDIKYIQHFLGHTSISTTQIYTHVNQKKQLEILSQKHPRHLFELENS